MPSSATSITSVPPSLEATSRTSLACECLAAFVSASLATKYAAASTGSGRRPVTRRLEPNGQRRAPAQVVERGRQAALDQDRRADPLAEVAQLLERDGERVARLAQDGPTAAGSAASFDSARPSVIAIETSRCCVPSCRSRSIRRRSVSVASTSRARDACSSASFASSSARSRSFSSVSAAAAQTESTSSGFSRSAGSWTSAATGSPSRSTTSRPVPPRPRGARPAGRPEST